MALDLTDCQFYGPALPEPFVRFELEKALNKLKVLPKTTGTSGKQLKQEWEVYRRRLRELAARGGAIRVRNQVVEPLVDLLGYDELLTDVDKVNTREGPEAGGCLLRSSDGTAKLRVWTTSFDEDLDAPAKRGRAYRFSHLRVAQRVLLASSERLGLLTNGVELRLLVSDPARPDSQVIIPLDPGWKRSRDVSDSYRFLLALACPQGVAALSDLVDKARLQQARVTKELRLQARQAVERFTQEVLDHPANRQFVNSHTDRDALARQLWREGLITIYRLLAILKLESSDDPARAFTFASTSLWRNTFSPTTALARYAHQVLEEGKETGQLLETGLQTLFRMFAQGMECTELVVKPLGGALFGADATPILSQCTWGERAVAHLLDRLLWTPKRRGADTRERVHYGALDVEDLGRVYEALLELEPGITSEPMCRLRRQKLEVVVPIAQGEKYRPAEATDENGEPTDEDDTDEDESPARGKKTKVQWIEAIQPGRFYLRVGLGRKASGSYYTPHSFVRFLVQETLGPQVAERSSQDDPQPMEILGLKVLDPAMGSGHFLVEACRFLGEKLYEACRLCDERALAAQRRAEKGKKADRDAALEEAQKWRQRVIDLPDPDDELLKYLPSRSPEGEESGYSQQRAEALCRRLVATHCLYGVDKNPLAVELAKLALWLESHAEGMPLTFMDHRLVVGDSLTGPFWDRLLTWPGKPQEKLDEGIYRGLENNLRARLFNALRHVRRLEASVGVTLAEVVEKQAAKADLDEALLPFRVAAAAWSGGVMLGPEKCDDVAYAELLQQIGITAELPPRIESERLRNMIACGLGIDEVPDGGDALTDIVKSGRCAPALSYDLTFPEVFYPNGVPFARNGFSATLGNPPWDKLRVERRDLMASIDPRFLTGKEKAGSGDEHTLIAKAFQKYPDARREEQAVSATKRCFPLCAGRAAEADDVLNASGDMDQYRLFLILASALTSTVGGIGFVVGGGFGKNPADAPTRRFMFNSFCLTVCAHYLNLKQLFGGASSRISFVLLAGPRTPPTETRIAFELTRFEDVLPRPDGTCRLVSVPLSRIRKQLNADADLTKLASEDSKMFASLSASRVDVISALTGLGIHVTNDLHRTNAKPALHELEEVLPGERDARLPSVVEHLLSRNYACSYDSRSLDQFDSLPTEKSGKWFPQTTLVADLRHPLVTRIAPRIRYFRMAWRATCGHPKTNERSARACILPPGVVAANSILLEKSPNERPNSFALIACSVINSFCLDSQARPVVQANLNKGVMSMVKWPALAGTLKPFLSHQCLRLSSNNSTYAPLWREQLGEEWRESGRSAFSWPVLAGDDERWAVRAAIDAVVADAYGLSRDQYQHVLSTFSHASYKQAPNLCLAAFDELIRAGLEAFTKKHDPYHDIPLNESLPEPVIDLPIPDEQPDDGDGRFKLTGAPKKGRSSKSKA